MESKPRQYSLVKLTDFMKNWLRENEQENSPLLFEEVFVFLGEIPNMPEHCIVSGHKSGKTLSGYHTSNFVELGDDEL